MSTRKGCPLPPGQGEQEEEQRQATPELELEECEVELRNKALLQQKRRLKQATQFVHKDSADLLPLDSLTRLGTSKDLMPSAALDTTAMLYPLCPPASEGVSVPAGVSAHTQHYLSRQQPHSVLQRRLLEGNVGKLRGDGRPQPACLPSPLATEQQDKAEGRRKGTSALLVHCQCQGQLLKATVNTGCLPNLISRSCLTQLGLEEVSAMDCGDLPLPISSVVGRVEHLELQLGQETVLCSALVVDDEILELCIGLQTLLSLKCCIDLEEGVLRCKALSQELPFLPAPEEPAQ